MLSKEEFQNGVKGMIEDLKDPEGEMAQIRQEFEELYADVQPHDAELATHFSEIMHAMDRMTAYLQTRAA